LIGLAPENGPGNTPAVLSGILCASLYPMARQEPALVQPA
jgi:hypothetical protein